MKKTQKAMKLSLFMVATLIACTSTYVIKADKAIEVAAVVVQKTPEEKALELIKPFFTDPNYQVNKSFKKMCCEVAELLKDSKDPVLKALAKVLKDICQKSSPMAIGMVLKQYEKAIKAFIGDMLPGTVLYARLEKALKL